MSKRVYEVYALRYATHPARRAFENFMFPDPHDKGPMPLDFFVWAIKGPDCVFVIDEKTAVKRHRTYLQSPIEMLRYIDIDAQDVSDVVITHMHYDHAGNLRAFPNARFHIQQDEMAYCTGRCMGYEVLRRPFAARDVQVAINCLFEGRMMMHKGRSELADGIVLQQVGGHTKGLQVVAVRTTRGQVVLASDAAHYWSNLRRRSPYPMMVDVDDMLDAYATVEALADGPSHIIPGHDPKVLEVFPLLNGNHNIALLHFSPIASDGVNAKLLPVVGSG